MSSTTGRHRLAAGYLFGCDETPILLATLFMAVTVGLAVLVIADYRLSTDPANGLLLVAHGRPTTVFPDR